MVTNRNCIAFLFFTACCGILNPACGGNLAGTDPPVECNVDADCDDGQSCTTDLCDSANSCRWLPDDGECADGEACQPYSGCAAAVACGGKGNPACTDGLSCTTDTCDDGVCRFQPRADCEEPADTTAPDTKILAYPTDPSDSPDATFTFTTVEPEDATTYECKLDGGATEACTSPKAYTGLANGPHTFEVRAKDEAGNVDDTPAKYTWTINAVAPATCTITCKGAYTHTDGLQYYLVEVSGQMRPSYYGDTDCVPAAGSRVRGGFDTEAGGSFWPPGSGTPHAELYTTDTPTEAAPYNVFFPTNARAINVYVDSCGYMDLNGEDGLAGRCRVVDASDSVDCRLTPNRRGIAMMPQP